MQPKHLITGANFCVDRMTFVSSMDAAGRETKGMHKKVVGRGNVLADEDRDESIDLGHVRLSNACDAAYNQSACFTRFRQCPSATV